MKWLHPLIRELLGYGMVSAVALAADFYCLLLFARFMHYLLAASISFIVGGFVAYALSVRFVFQQRKVTRASAELGLFLLLGFAGLTINTMILSIAVGQWSLPLPWAKIAAAGGTFTSNFALRKWLLFTRSESAVPAHPSTQ